MSDTPRTDKIISRIPPNNHRDDIWVNHSRQLERENADLRKDKERLDWLEKNCEWLHLFEGSFCVKPHRKGATIHDSLRKAIEQAREQ